MSETNTCGKNRSEFGQRVLPYPLIHASFALGAGLALLSPRLAVLVGGFAFFLSVAISFGMATERWGKSNQPEELT